MANNIKKIIKIVLAAAFWILIWEAASLLIKGDLSLFLPSPFAVFKAFFKMLFKVSFLKAVGATLFRIFMGLFIGTVLGIILGICTGESKVADILISPALRIVRSVPVVSFIILAYLFISVNHLPVFISSLMVTPIVWQGVNDSIIGTDKKMTDMAKVYKLSKTKTLFNVKLFLGKDRIFTSIISAVGLAWKSGVAAEVLSSPAVSIGKSIYKAKGNLNFDEVYALTITVVILSLIFEFFIKYLFDKRKERQVKKNVQTD